MQTHHESQCGLKNAFQQIQLHTGAYTVFLSQCKTCGVDRRESDHRPVQAWKEKLKMR